MEEEDNGFRIVYYNLFELEIARTSSCTRCQSQSVLMANDPIISLQIPEDFNNRSAYSI